MRIIQMMGGGDVGGAKTHIMTLVQELSKTNEVCLVSFRESSFAEEAAACGIHVKVFPYASPWKCRDKMLELIREFKPEILHSHGSKANIVSALLRAKCDLPLMSTVHSDYRKDYMGMPYKQYTLGTMNAIALRFMDFYQPVADSMARTLISRGFDPERMRVIPNGMDFSNPVENFDRTAYIKENWNVTVTDDDILCGLAARLTAVKDIFTCIRGFAGAVREQPNMKLFLAGDGEDESKLRRLAEELGVADKVIFCGWVSPIDKFFAAMDINLLTSVSEGFPYSILEGVREHCATVCTDVGGLRDLIDTGENGFLFDVGDHETLSKYLLTLARDAECRARFTSLLYEKAVKKYSLQTMCQVQEENYRMALRKHYREKSKRDSIVICGAYGKGNAGDEAILQAIVHELREIDPDRSICVLSRRPEETRLRCRTQSVYTFNLLKVHKYFRHAGLYINGGGSLIQDVTSTRSLQYYLLTMGLAKHLGCRIMMYGCGIGPVNKEHNRKRSAKVINRSVDVITLRDALSKEELKKLNITRPQIELAADPTMALKPASPALIDLILEKKGIDPNGNYIGLGLRKWKGFDNAVDEIVKTAEYAYETHGLTPVFVPIEYPEDLEPARIVAEKLHCPYHMITSQESIEVTIGILAKMKLVIGMRLHSLIFSVSQSVPVIGMSYDIKVDGLLRYIDSRVCVNLNDVTAEKINPLIDAYLAGKLENSVQEASEKLLHLERVNVECVRSLLEKIK